MPSRFAQLLGPKAGIVSLMQDLGQALAEGGGGMRMLGGGNPAHIPAVQDAFRDSLQALLDDRARFAALIGDYDPPAGHPGLRLALAELLQQHYGWPITADNIALTNGSQAGFFLLFNLLAGEQVDGSQKHICLPLTPEYIGYGDLGLRPGLFQAQKPVIQELADKLFKYRVDFAHLHIDQRCAGVCVSRPTNPTGNVIADAELAQLHQRCRAAGVPLIIDGAYGTPFPEILFTDITPIWDRDIIVCLSLSKLGLPAARCGIVVADETMISALAAANTISCLATGSIGAGMAEPLVRSGEILRLSRDIIKPFYQQRCQAALQQLQAALQDLPTRIHVPEGALFLWLWCPDLPISSQELYQRLKRRQVLVVPGEHFFPGLPDDGWRHRHECLRISYAMDPRQVSEGLAIIAEEVRAAYGA